MNTKDLNLQLKHLIVDFSVLVGLEESVCSVSISISIDKRISKTLIMHNGVIVKFPLLILIAHSLETNMIP